MSNRTGDRTADTGHAAGIVLSAREAALALGVHERTVRRAIARGVLPAVKIAGVYQIAETDLAQFRSRRPDPSRAASRSPTGSPWLIRFPTRDGPPLFVLPRPRTPIIGRESVLADVSDLLLNPDVPLITLVGPGGLVRPASRWRSLRWCRRHLSMGSGLSTLRRSGIPR